MSDEQAPIEKLSDVLVQELLDRIAAGTATAADLSVARSLLRDNGIQSVRKPGKKITKLAEILGEEADDEFPFK